MKKVVSLLLVLCMTSVAFAEDGMTLPEAPDPYTTSQPRLLPEFVRCHEDYACFDLEATRQLFLLENEARRTFYLLEREQQLNLQLEEVVVNLRTQVVNYATIANMHEGRIDTLEAQLEEEIKAKNKWRAEAEDPTIWPYLVGGVLSLLAAGVLVGVLTSQLGE